MESSQLLNCPPFPLLDLRCNEDPRGQRTEFGYPLPALGFPPTASSRSPIADRRKLRHEGRDHAASDRARRGRQPASARASRGGQRVSVPTAREVAALEREP